MTDTAGARPLRIGVLVSATGANLSTLLDLQRREPERFQVALVASHGERAGALRVAREAGVETWTGDFDEVCGLASRAEGPEDRARYRALARTWHDGLDDRIRAWERGNGDLDLIVLAYHRWIEGRLLERYRGRMINQHPGDLSVLDAQGRRVLVGKDPVRTAMRLGHRSTRTSCFLVDGTRDGGPVLCMGPEVATGGRPATVEAAWQQELEQKERSDRACLEWTVRALADGRVTVSDRTHRDGSRVVLVDGNETPLGGMRMAEEGR
ncbi:formyltransferase family protein [Streptomyces sp. NBC_01565]|uniref:formyltransferase family protein n=1 Tax=unclassified Streptomyces TaxID=2593676 RepID=UPI0022523937|nr:formyltransferase family protein [Streptomyces sp. NBC_01565]MCX4542431.1 formyltransferase family protein [Streptomyces sp. NBC_01565]